METENRQENTKYGMIFMLGGLRAAPFCLQSGNIPVYNSFSEQYNRCKTLTPGNGHVESVIL